MSVASASIDDLVREILREVLRGELLPAIREEVKAALAAGGPPGEEASPVVGEYLTVERAAEIASVHPATVRKWLRSGALGRYAAGSAPRIRASELHAYLAREARPESGVSVEEQAAEILARRRRKRLRSTVDTSRIV